MIPKRIKTARIGCLVSLALFLVVGVFLANRYQAMNSCHGNSPLLRSLDVTIDPSQNQQFVEQSRQFAYKHSFRLDVADFEHPASDLRVVMTGKDIQVVTRSASQPGGFKIGFYNYDCIHPTMVSDIDDLVNDLKNFIIKIPGVTITE